MTAKSNPRSLVVGAILLVCTILMAGAYIQHLFPSPATPAPQAMNKQASKQTAEDTPLSEQQQATLAPLMGKLQTNPNDPQTLLAIGNVFVQAQDWPRAESFLNKAALSSPNEASTRSLLGFVQYNMGKFAEAAATLESGLGLRENPEDMFNLSAIYKYKLFQTEKANALLEKIMVSPAADSATKKMAQTELSRPAPAPKQ